MYGVRTECAQPSGTQRKTVINGDGNMETVSVRVNINVIVSVCLCLPLKDTICKSVLLSTHSSNSCCCCCCRCSCYCQCWCSPVVSQHNVAIECTMRKYTIIRCATCIRSSFFLHFYIWLLSWMVFFLSSFSRRAFSSLPFVAAKAFLSLSRSVFVSFSNSRKQL